MDEFQIILENEPVLMIELDGNQGIADPPDPYDVAVANGYQGTKAQWLYQLFDPTATAQLNALPDLLTLYRLAKI